MYFGIFQGLTVVFRSPEDPEILQRSGAGWRGEAREPGSTGLLEWIKVNRKGFAVCLLL